MGKAYEFLLKFKQVGVEKISQAAGAVGKMKENVQKAAYSISELDTKISNLQAARKFERDTNRIREMNAEVRRLQGEMQRLENLPPKNFFQNLFNLNGIAKTVAASLIGVFALGQVSAFAREVVNTTAEFQRYEAVLTNTFGSNAVAKQSMDDIVQFASKTPFAVNELTDSYIKLVNRGFVPTQNEMTKLGDLASSVGKPFDQLTEAILDAQTGEFERLKEFGIRASKAGDQVTFAFKGQSQTVKFTEQSIRDYVLSLGDLQGVSGAMAAISQTLGGKLSNLQDNVMQLRLKIGNALAPAMGWMVDRSSAFITILSDNLPVVAAFGASLGTLALVMTGYSAAQWIAKKSTDELTKSIIKQNLAMLANPYLLIAAAVIGLITYLVYLYNTSEKVRGFFSGMMGAFQEAISGFSEWISGVWEGVKLIAEGIWEIYSGFYAGILNVMKQIWSAIKSTFTSIKDFVVGIWDSIFSGTSSAWTGLKKLVSGFADTIMKALGPVGDWLKGFFSPLWDGFKNIFNKIKTFALDFLGSAGGWLADKLGIDVEKIKSGLSKIKLGAGMVGDTSADYAGKIADGYNKGKASGIEELKKQNALKGAGGTSSVASPELSQGLGDITSGGSKQTNISLSLGKLQDSINIYAQNIDESADELERKISEAVLRALNGVIIAAGG
jgi:hypothetical protein